MDIQELTRWVMKVISPYLLKGGLDYLTGVGEKLKDKTQNKLANQIWKHIQGEDQEGYVEETASKLSKNPEDGRYQNRLEADIKSLLESNDKLVEALTELSIDANSKSLNVYIGRDVIGTVNVANKIVYEASPNTFDENIALSRSPRPNRSTIYKIPLIGREQDKEWLLSNLQNDKLLIGQPGSGKTFLLRHFVQEVDGAFFVVGKERGRISQEIVIKQPQVLIVDDAHIEENSEIIQDLLQLRQDLMVDFSIIVSSWPDEDTENTMRSLLNLSDANKRELGRLNRDQIVTIINEVGIQNPKQLIREINDQVVGLPGLAVFLTQLYLNGDINDVLSGDALLTQMMSDFKKLVGANVTNILGVFSVGGSAGLPTSYVAELLDYRDSEIVEMMSLLAAGGMVNVVDWNENRLSVQPPMLQYVLIREVFFKESFSLLKKDDLDTLLQRIPISIAAIPLIGAKTVGANIPFEFLVNVVTQTNTREVWKGFAALGEEYVRWVLDTYPDLLSDIAYPALYYVPNETIALLLENAVDDDRRLNSTPEHPLRILEDWATSARSGDIAVQRRKAVLDSVSLWYQKSGDSTVILKCFPIIFDWGIHFTESDPGIGNSMTISEGCLPLSSLKDIRKLWPIALEILSMLEIENWKSLKELVRTWAYPYLARTTIPEDMRVFMDDFAREILYDLVQISNQHPGILHWANGIKDTVTLEAVFEEHPIFEILYPHEHRGDDWSERNKEQISNVKKLAQDWADKSPNNVLKEIQFLEKAAIQADITYPRMTSVLYTELAKQVKSPMLWLNTGLDNNMSGEYILPFLNQAVEINEAGWIEIALAFLNNPLQQQAIMSLIVPMENPPKELFEAVLKKLENEEKLGIYHRQEPLPEETIQRLLMLKNNTVAWDSAYQEWYSNPKGEIRKSLQENWFNVIVNAPFLDDKAADNKDHFDGTTTYRLAEILKDDSETAFAWLKARMQSESLHYSRFEEAYQSALNVLSKTQKVAILRMVKSSYGTDDLIKDLIGDDLELYKILLQLSDLKSVHLAPLGGELNEIWLQKTLMALGSGFEPIEIVTSTCYSIRSWSGKESQRWQGWIDRFGKYVEHENPQIQAVSKQGVEYAQPYYAKAIEHERKEAIYGWR